MCHHEMQTAMRMDTDAIAHNDYQSCDDEAMVRLYFHWPVTRNKILYRCQFLDQCVFLFLCICF